MSGPSAGDGSSADTVLSRRSVSPRLFCAKSWSELPTVTPASGHALISSDPATRQCRWDANRGKRWRGCCRASVQVSRCAGQFGEKWGRASARASSDSRPGYRIRDGFCDNRRGWVRDHSSVSSIVFAMALNLFVALAVSKVKRNTELSERKYQVETQVQACWRRLRRASGMHVWHEAGR